MRWTFSFILLPYLLLFGEPEPHNVRLFCNSSGVPIKELTYSEGEIIHRRFLTWNGEQLLIDLTDDGSQEEESDLEGVSKRIRLTYDPVRNETICEEAFPPDFIFIPVDVVDLNKEKNDPSGRYSYVEAAYSQLQQLWKKQNNLLDGTYWELRQTAEYLFGEDNLIWWGVYPDEVENGVVGHGEVSDKVRITGMNGILNSKKDCQLLALTLSEIHGGINIHYVYWPSGGWTKDLINCAFAKAGYRCAASRLLAKTWKELIDEMGGVNSGGRIIHYCHSIGCATSEAAKTLLEEEEQEMIHLFAFGPPQIVADEGFGHVTNYISYRDGVCILDPFRYVEALSGDLSHVKLVGDLNGPPLIDHMIITGAYFEVLEELGAQFQKDYPR